MKIIIGKSRIVNWAIFIHFIKKEIERSVEKLFRNVIIISNIMIKSNISEKNYITDKEKGDTYKENIIMENNLESENYY